MQTNTAFELIRNKLTSKVVAMIQIAVMGRMISGGKMKMSFRMI